MRNKVIGLLFMLILIGLGGHSVGVNAAQAGFSIKPQFPQNQTDPKLGYYDLTVVPEQETVLKVTIINNEDKSITVKPQIHTATTNLNGVVNYADLGTSDKSLKYKMTDLVKSEQAKYTIPARSKTEAAFVVTAPSKSFDGVLAGGLSFVKQVASQSTESNGQAQVTNRFAYAVAILLRSEGQPAPAADLKLGTVKTGTVSQENSLFVNVRNVKPAYLHKVSAETKIYPADKDKAIYTRQQANMQIAPNSILPFKVPLNGDPFVPGRYRMTMAVRAGVRSWKFSKNFTITAAEAAKWNTETLGHNPIKDYTLWWWLGGFGLLLLVGIAWYLYARNRKLKQQVQQMNS